VADLFVTDLFVTDLFVTDLFVTAASPKEAPGVPHWPGFQYSEHGGGGQ